jgi:hypothetical protein
MKRKTKLLTIRIDQKTYDKVAKLKELEYGLVTKIVVDAINNYQA